MNAPPEEKVIAQLKSDHSGRELNHITVSSDDGNEYHFVAITPDKVQWQRFMAESQEDSKRPAALEWLARRQVVWPDAKVVQELFNERPALAGKVAGQVAAAAGAHAEASRKKL